MKTNPGLLTAACVAAISLAAFADEPKKDAADPKADRIGELEQENARLRAENILLKNKLANLDRKEKDQATETEKHAREAIRKLLPNLEITPPVENGQLPELRFRNPSVLPGQPPQTGVKIWTPENGQQAVPVPPRSPHTPKKWIRKRFNGVDTYVVPLVMTPETRGLDNDRRLAAPVR